MGASASSIIIRHKEDPELVWPCYIGIFAPMALYATHDVIDSRWRPRKVGLLWSVLYLISNLMWITATIIYVYAQLGEDADADPPIEANHTEAGAAMIAFLVNLVTVRKVVRGFMVFNMLSVVAQRFGLVRPDCASTLRCPGCCGGSRSEDQEALCVPAARRRYEHAGQLVERSISVLMDDDFPGDSARLAWLPLIFEMAVRSSRLPHLLGARKFQRTAVLQDDTDLTIMTTAWLWRSLSEVPVPTPECDYLWPLVHALDRATLVAYLHINGRRLEELGTSYGCTDVGAFGLQQREAYDPSASTFDTSFEDGSPCFDRVLQAYTNTLKVVNAALLLYVDLKQLPSRTVSCSNKFIDGREPNPRDHVELLHDVGFELAPRRGPIVLSFHRAAATNHVVRLMCTAVKRAFRFRSCCCSSSVYVRSHPSPRELTTAVLEDANRPFQDVEPGERTVISRKENGEHLPLLSRWQEEHLQHKEATANAAIAGSPDTQPADYYSDLRKDAKKASQYFSTVSPPGPLKPLPASESTAQRYPPLIEAYSTSTFPCIVSAVTATRPEQDEKIYMMPALPFHHVVGTARLAFTGLADLHRQLLGTLPPDASDRGISHGLLKRQNPDTAHLCAQLAPATGATQGCNGAPDARLAAAHATVQEQGQRVPSVPAHQCLQIEQGRPPSRSSGHRVGSSRPSGRGAQAGASQGAHASGAGRPVAEAARPREQAVEISEVPAQLQRDDAQQTDAYRAQQNCDMHRARQLVRASIATVAVTDSFVLHAHSMRSIRPMTAPEPAGGASDTLHWWSSWLGAQPVSRLTDAGKALAQSLLSTFRGVPRQLLESGHMASTDILGSADGGASDGDQILASFMEQTALAEHDFENVGIIMASTFAAVVSNAVMLSEGATQVPESASNLLPDRPPPLATQRLSLVLTALHHAVCTAWEYLLWRLQTDRRVLWTRERVNKALPQHAVYAWGILRPAAAHAAVESAQALKEFRKACVGLDQVLASEPEAPNPPPVAALTLLQDGPPSVTLQNLTQTNEIEWTAQRVRRAAAEVASSKQAAQLAVAAISRASARFDVGYLLSWDVAWPGPDADACLPAVNGACIAALGLLHLAAFQLLRLLSFSHGETMHMWSDAESVRRHDACFFTFHFEQLGHRLKGEAFESAPWSRYTAQLQRLMQYTQAIHDQAIGADQPHGSEPAAGRGQREPEARGLQAHRQSLQDGLSTVQGVAMLLDSSSAALTSSRERLLALCCALRVWLDTLADARLLGPTCTVYLRGAAATSALAEACARGAGLRATTKEEVHSSFQAVTFLGWMAVEMHACAAHCAVQQNHAARTEVRDATMKQHQDSMLDAFQRAHGSLFKEELDAAKAAEEAYTAELRKTGLACAAENFAAADASADLMRALQRSEQKRGERSAAVRQPEHISPIYAGLRTEDHARTALRTMDYANMYAADHARQERDLALVLQAQLQLANMRCLLLFGDGGGDRVWTRRAMVAAAAGEVGLGLMVTDMWRWLEEVCERNGDGEHADEAADAAPSQGDAAKAALAALTESSCDDENVWPMLLNAVKRGEQAYAALKPVPQIGHTMWSDWRLVALRADELWKEFVRAQRTELSNHMHPLRNQPFSIAQSMAGITTRALSPEVATKALGAAACGGGDGAQPETLGEVLHAAEGAGLVVGVRLQRLVRELLRKAPLNVRE